MAMNIPEKHIKKHTKNLEKKIIMREYKKEEKKRNMTRKKNPSHPPSSFSSFLASITTYLNLLLPFVSQTSHHCDTYKPTIHNPLSPPSPSHYNSFSSLPAYTVTTTPLQPRPNANNH